MHLKNLCRISIFIIATTVCTGSESQTDIIKVHFSSVPIHYKLNLVLSKDKSEKDKSDDVKTINKHKSVSFDGESRIIINILHPISLIKIQKLNQLITLAKLITRNGITYEIRDYIYDRASNLLKIYFNDVLLPGFYTLKMVFIDDTTYDNVEGFFKISYINKYGVIQ